MAAQDDFSGRFFPVDDTRLVLAAVQHGHEPPVLVQAALLQQRRRRYVDGLGKTDLKSTCSLDAISGVIAAQGDLGAIQRDSQGRAVQDASGRLTRFGGIDSGGRFSGQLIVLGNVFGDLTLQEGLRGGRIAVHGRSVAGLDSARVGILGNVNVDDLFDAGGVIVSGGMIGDAVGATALNARNINGIVAAKGAITLSADARTKHAAFFGGDLGATPGNANAAIIDAIFQSAFDVDSAKLDLGGLSLIEANLAALQVGKDGNLNLAKP